MSYRPEEKFHGTHSSGKLKRPEYHHARFNHSSSNGDESNLALLPTLPSVHMSNLQCSLSLLHIEDKGNSLFQAENPSCPNEGTGTVTNRGDKCFDGGCSCCVVGGKKAVPSDSVLGNKRNVDSSRHEDCQSCTSHHTQCSYKQICRKCSDDEGRKIQEAHTETCSHQTSYSCQSGVLSACVCQNHVTGLNIEKEDHVKVLQNSEEAKNCLIRTHSAENVTRNDMNCHRSNCNCSAESFSSTKMRLHAANSEQCQKCSQPGICRKICEHYAVTDTVNVKHFSSVKCNAHNDDKGQDCKPRNCLHHTCSLDNPPMLQHFVEERQQGSHSHPLLHNSGCHRSVSDMNVFGVGSNEVFKKHGLECTRQVESARTVTGTGEVKTNTQCVTHSPLSSLRLQPTRHRAKGVICSILESGEVCIEFLRKRNGNREEKVVNVCRISGDGLRVRNIKLYI